MAAPHEPPAPEASSGLIVPPRVYLDTANLAALADEPPGGPRWPRFLRLVRSGLIVPVFSYAQVTERLATSEDTLARLDTRVTPLLNEGHGIWVRDYNTLQYVELQNELARQEFGRRHPLCPTVANALELLPQLDTSGLERFPGFRFIAGVEARRERPPFRTLGPGFVGFQERQRKARGRRRLKDGDVMDAIRPYLPVGCEGKFPEGFVLDRKQMPFINLMAGYFSGSLVSDGGDDDSDLLDVLHLGGVAYSDLGFVDKRTFDKLSRGKVLRAGIHRNAEFDSLMEQLDREGPL